MSFLNHMRSLRQDVVTEMAGSAIADGIELGPGGPPPLDDVHEFFDWWLDAGLFFHHLATFWAHRDEGNVRLFHYDDMKADLPGQMQRVATARGSFIR